MTLPSYLELVKACDSFPYDESSTELYRLLLPNDARTHGLMLSRTVESMPWTAEFEINHSQRTVQLKDISEGRDTKNACNAAFQNVVSKAIDEDIFEILHQRHSEPYLIVGSNYQGQLERFSHCLFGIAARGAHMTAYVRTSSGLKIWVPRRAAHLFTYPGKLDSTVAGGVKATDTPHACIVGEALEEASLPESLIKEKLHSAGILTYVTTYNSPKRRETDMISPEVLYLYDLELPADVVLKPQDDEVERFYLMDVDEVKEAMARSEFKTNSAVVMIDFFVRHGIITSENEPDYVTIISRMHRRLPVATAPLEHVTTD